MDGRKGKDKNQQTRKAGNADLQTAFCKAFRKTTWGLALAEWDTQTKHLNNPQLNQKGYRDVQTLHMKVFRIQLLVVGNPVLPVPCAALESFSRKGTCRNKNLDCQGWKTELPGDHPPTLLFLCRFTARLMRNAQGGNTAPLHCVSESLGAFGLTPKEPPDLRIKIQNQKGQIKPFTSWVCIKREKQSLLQPCEAFRCLERSLRPSLAEETAEFNNHLVSITVGWRGQTYALVYSLLYYQLHVGS